MSQRIRVGSVKHERSFPTMARDLNKVMITGRLGADPEMRFTPQGSPVTTFRVASGRSWRSADGTSHDDTEWFRVVAWEKLAEICNQYLTKGARVYVEGRLQTRKYQDRDGQERYSTEVIANDMIILSSRRDGDGDDDAPVSLSGHGGDYGDATAKSPARPASNIPAARPATPARNRPAPLSDTTDAEFDAPPSARPRPASGAARKPPTPPQPEDDGDLPF